MTGEPLLEIGYEIREAFFDRLAVMSRIDAGKRKALSKVGAYVRTRSRSSLKKPRRLRLSELPEDRQRIFERRQQQAEAKGETPPTLPFASSAPGEPPRTPTRKLKDTIFFAYEPVSESVVIGPIKLSGTKGKDAPATLEGGGDQTIFGRNVHIEARPFMGPALEAEQSKAPGLFEGIL